MRQQKKARHRVPPTPPNKCSWKLKETSVCFSITFRICTHGKCLFYRVIVGGRTLMPSAMTYDM